MNLVKSQQEEIIIIIRHCARHYVHLRIGWKGNESNRWDTKLWILQYSRALQLHMVAPATTNNRIREIQENGLRVGEGL